MTILYVDDDHEDAEIFCEAIASIDGSIRCVIARSGEEALEKISVQCPDFTFLDFRMPLSDGIDVLKEMRRHDCFPKTKVVMYSTFMDTNHIEECKKLGVFDCLAKSSVFSDLCVALRTTLGKDTGS